MSYAKNEPKKEELLYKDNRRFGQKEVSDFPFLASSFSFEKYRITYLFEVFYYQIARQETSFLHEISSALGITKDDILDYQKEQTDSLPGTVQWYPEILEAFSVVKFLLSNEHCIPDVLCRVQEFYGIPNLKEASQLQIAKELENIGTVLFDGKYAKSLFLKKEINNEEAIVLCFMISYLDIIFEKKSLRSLCSYVLKRRCLCLQIFCPEAYQNLSFFPDNILFSEDSDKSPNECEDIFHSRAFERYKKKHLKRIAEYLGVEESKVMPAIAHTLEPNTVYDEDMGFYLNYPNGKEAFTAYAAFSYSYRKFSHGSPEWMADCSKLCGIAPVHGWATPSQLPNVSMIVDCYFRSALNGNINDGYEKYGITKLSLSRDYCTPSPEYDLLGISSLFYAAMDKILIDHMMEKLIRTSEGNSASSDNRTLIESLNLKFSKQKEIIEDLNLKLKKQDKEENKKLYPEQKMISDLKKQVENLKEELSKKDKLIKDQEELIDVLQVEEEEVPNVLMTKEYYMERLSNKRFLFVGDLASMSLTELRQLFPNSSFMESSNADINIRADGVVVFAAAAKHSMYYKVKNNQSLAKLPWLVYRKRGGNRLLDLLAAMEKKF